MKKKLTLKLFSLRVKADERCVNLVVVKRLATLASAEIHAGKQPPGGIVRCQFGVRRLVAGFAHRFLPLAWCACDVRNAQYLKHAQYLAVAFSERERALDAVMRHGVNLLDDSNHVFIPHILYCFNKFWVQSLSFKQRIVVKCIGLGRQDTAEPLLAWVTADIICSHCSLIKKPPVKTA